MPPVDANPAICKSSDFNINEYLLNKMPPSHYIVQGYMTPDGYTAVKYFDIEYAVGDKGNHIPMPVETFADDPDYTFCDDCKLYIHKSEHAVKKHKHIHEMSLLQKTKLEIRSVRHKGGSPAFDDKGRVIYYFGAYKDVSTGRAIHTPEGYKEIFRSEVMDVNLQTDCACLSCAITQRQQGHPIKVDLASGINTRDSRDVIIDEAFDLTPGDDVGNLPRIEDPEVPEAVWVRFAKPIGPDGNTGKYFEVEFRNHLTSFNLVDGDQGELETINRFTHSKSDQISTHRIHVDDDKIIWIDVDWQGRVINACISTQTHQEDGTRHDTRGYSDEFFLPSNHIFLGHVNIQTVMKGLI